MRGKKLKVCQQVLSPSMQKQNRSFEIVARTKRPRNIQKYKTLMKSEQKFCFLLLNMQILDAYVAVVIAVP